MNEPLLCKVCEKDITISDSKFNSHAAIAAKRGAERMGIFPVHAQCLLSFNKKNQKKIIKRFDIR